MAVFVHVFFFNPFKIDCFIIKEGKYPNICYNGFLIPLASDNISFYKTLPRNMYVKTLLVVADPLFKRSICDKVPLLLFIALPGIQRKSTKSLRYCWEPQISEKKLIPSFFPSQKKTRCSVELQCYKLFVKGTWDWIDNFPYLWKKHLGKDLTFHSDDMAPQRLYIHHFHIVHNTPCLSPKFYITIVSNFSWVQWLGKISEGEQGALWSMWKKWINSRIMIISLATKKNALSPIWNASVLFQMFFHFWTSFVNPDEVMQERFKIHPLWNCTCEAQFSNLVKPHSGTSDQSNQSPSQPVILTNSQSGQ